MSELKACPFCGGEASCGGFKRDYPTQNIQVYVKCHDCDAEINIVGNVLIAETLRQKAAYAWNRRPTPENKPEFTAEADCAVTGLPCSGCTPCCGSRREDTENKLLTVADHIRSMSNEELADLLNQAEGAGYNDSSIAPKGEDNYPMDMLEWLNQPYARKPEVE